LFPTFRFFIDVERVTAAKKLVRKSIRLLKTLRFELLFKPPLPKIPSTDSHRAKWPSLGSRFRIFPPAPERKIGAVRFQSLTSSCCDPSPCSSGIRPHRSTSSRRPSHDVGAGEASHTSAGLGVARTNDIVPEKFGRAVRGFMSQGCYGDRGPTRACGKVSPNPYSYDDCPLAVQ
jgi:hypothetical protein